MSDQATSTPRLADMEAGVEPSDAWWSRFGDDYDTSGSAPAAAVEELEDQVSLNARTLAQLEAKSALLVASEAAAASLRSQLNQHTVSAASRERALHSSLTEAQVAIEGLSEAAARARASSSDAQAALATREQECESVSAQLRSLQAVGETMRAEVVDSEAEITSLRLALEEERSDGMLERLDKLLAPTQKPPMASASSQTSTEPPVLAQPARTVVVAHRRPADGRGHGEPREAEVCTCACICHLCMCGERPPRPVPLICHSMPPPTTSSTSSTSSTSPPGGRQAPPCRLGTRNTEHGTLNSRRARAPR